MDQLMTAGDAAKALKVTPDAIRDRARRGTLRVTTYTAGGVRLFSKADVDALRRRRRQVGVRVHRTLR